MPSKLQKKRKKNKDHRASKKSNAATATDVVISEDTEPDTDGESTGIHFHNLKTFYSDGVFVRL